MTGSEIGAGAVAGAGAAKGLGGLATGIIAAVVIGGGVFAYVQYGGSPAPTPEVALGQMLSISDDRKTGESHATFNIKISGLPLGQVYGGSADEPSVIKGTIDSKVDMTDRAKVDGAITISAMLSDEKEANKLSATIDLISLRGGEKLYMKVVLPPMLSGASIYSNKWIEMSPEELASMYGIPAAPTSGTVDIEKTKELLAKLKESGIIKITKSLGSDTVNDTDAYRYAYKIDLAAVPNFLPEIAKLQGTELTTAEITEMTTQWNAGVVDAFKDVKFGGELWVSKENPRNVRMTSATSLKKSDEIPADIDIDIDAAEVSYNKPVTIVAPEGAVSFQELMQSMQPMDDGMMPENDSMDPDDLDKVMEESLGGH
jgi:hypothetical protein